MGIKRVAALAATGTLLLTACSSFDDDYWSDAARDACQKSIATKTLDSDPSFSDVKAESTGDKKWTVTGKVLSADFDNLTRRGWTCEAWMDGTEAAGRATFDGTVEDFN